ncbi:protein kinase [Candidatus Margulisiibacteriota bacterium]
MSLQVGSNISSSYSLSENKSNKDENQKKKTTKSDTSAPKLTKSEKKILSKNTKLFEQQSQSRIEFVNKDIKTSISDPDKETKNNRESEFKSPKTDLSKLEDGTYDKNTKSFLFNDEKYTVNERITKTLYRSKRKDGTEVLIRRLKIPNDPKKKELLLKRLDTMQKMSSRYNDIKLTSMATIDGNSLALEFEYEFNTIGTENTKKLMYKYVNSVNSYIDKELLDVPEAKGTYKANIYRVILEKVVMGEQEFKVDKSIGDGAFGSVYKATTKDGKQIALKEIKLSTDLDSNQLEHEIEIMLKTRSIDGTAKIISFGSSYNDTIKNSGEKVKVFYIAMDLVDGSSLNIEIEKIDPKNIEHQKTLQSIFKPIIEMHSKNLIHKDLKPENILVNKQREAKLVDFGHSQECKDSKHKSGGTPEYIAPEVVQKQFVSAKQQPLVDSFSMGVILYELLEGSESKNTTDNIYTNKKFFKNIFTGKVKPDTLNHILFATAKGKKLESMEVEPYPGTKNPKEKLYNLAYHLTYIKRDTKTNKIVLDNRMSVEEADNKMQDIFKEINSKTDVLIR